jgi:hypothetical protein
MLISHAGSQREFALPEQYLLEINTVPRCACSTREYPREPMAALRTCRYGGWQYGSMLRVALLPRKHRRGSVAFSMRIHPCAAHARHNSPHARQKARLGCGESVAAASSGRLCVCVCACWHIRLKQRLQTFAFALECHTKVAEIDAAIEARRAALRRARL